MRTLPLALLWACACGDDAAPDPAPDFTPAPASIAVFETSYRDVATSGARAQLADAAPVYQVEVARAAACRLLVFEAGLCDPPCDAVCVVDQCVRPALRSAGTITLSGLAAPVTLSADDAAAYAQDQTELPADLFTAGAALTASAPGDQRVGFEVAVDAVAPIAPVLSADVLTLGDEVDSVIGWDAAEPGTRVRADLLSPAEAIGQPAFAHIECDAPDTGSLSVPLALVAMFPKQARGAPCPTAYCPLSSLARYRTAAVATADGDVELTAAAEVRFALVH